MTQQIKVEKECEKNNYVICNSLNEICIEIFHIIIIAVRIAIKIELAYLPIKYVYETIIHVINNNLCTDCGRMLSQ